MPTSVGFATSARAKCAFIVLQKISRSVEPGGHPAERQTPLNLSESTLMG